VNPKAVLFDLDDTLHDRRASVDAFAPTLHAHLEPWLSGAKLEAFNQTLHRVDHGGYVARELFMARLLEAFGVTSGFDAVALAEFWRSSFAVHAQPMRGARELLEHLRSLGIKTGIVTNGTVRLQLAKIAALELRVDAVVISEQVGVKKPAPAPFLECLKRLEVRARDAWFVGDHAVNDIAGAHGVGMRAFWLEREQHLEPVGVDFARLESLSDLKMYLNSD
jgi:putative hydrolase of the HAD superfamily